MTEGIVSAYLLNKSQWELSTISDLGSFRYAYPMVAGLRWKAKASKLPDLI